MKLKRLTLPVVLIAAIIVLTLTFTKKLPNDMMGSFALMFVLGLIFGELGDRIPFVRNWLGGGPIFCIFGPALLIYFKILPKEVVDIMKTFMDKTNFFAFFIAVMVSGAIFTISRKIIIKSSLKFLPSILGGSLLAFVLAAVGGVVTGYGWREAVFYLAIPIMGGGVGAGAVPLSQIYSQTTGIDAAKMLSTVMPAVVLGNVGAILTAGLLNRLGKKFPSWTGNGELMRVSDKEVMEEIERERKVRQSAPMTIESLGSGFFIAILFYIAGYTINSFLFPKIHAFVWLILLLTGAKALKLLPESLEIDTIQWSNVWVKNLLYAALIPIGIGYTDIAQTLTAISNPAYLVITILTVVGATIGAAFAGKWFGLYPIESAISGGLCMANMAQTGDLATLAAADRMELLPYSAYSSRIGGSLILVLAGILISFIGLR